MQRFGSVARQRNARGLSWVQLGAEGPDPLVPRQELASIMSATSGEQNAEDYINRADVQLERWLSADTWSFSPTGRLYSICTPLAEVP